MLFHSCSKPELEESLTSQQTDQTLTQQTNEFSELILENTLIGANDEARIFKLSQHQISQLLEKQSSANSLGLNNSNKCLYTIQDGQSDLECCCVDALYYGGFIPGLPAGVVSLDRNYQTSYAQSYRMNIQVYKAGRLIYTSVNFFDTLCPDPYCGYGAFTATFPGLDECPGDIVFVIKKLYETNHGFVECDRDSYSFYWPGNPIYCSKF